MQFIEELCEMAYVFCYAITVNEIRQIAIS